MPATKTSTTPYLAVRRLRKLTYRQIARRDDKAMEWIEQAAITISQLAKEKQKLSMQLSNYTRPRGFRADEVEWSASKNGCVYPIDDKRLLATRILDTLEDRRELWRLPNGTYKLLREGSPPSAAKAEFLGLFDLGATVEDILEAIE